VEQLSDAHAGQRFLLPERPWLNMGKAEGNQDRLARLIITAVTFCALTGTLFRLTRAESKADTARIKRHVESLASDIGARPAGSDELARAFDYVKQKLTALGYAVESQEVRMPQEAGTTNLWADKRGDSREVMVFAAHLDTVPGSPGANDDGTGVALLLEMARLLHDSRTGYTLRFLFFGAEEEVHGFDGHGLSSLAYVDSLKKEEVHRIKYAFWLDKLGRGAELKMLHIRQTPEQALEAASAAAEMLRLEVNRRTVSPWSKRMAFEDLSIPTVWIEWGPDPELHKATDTANRLDWKKVDAVARIAMGLAELKAGESGDHSTMTMASKSSPYRLPSSVMSNVTR